MSESAPRRRRHPAEKTVRSGAGRRRVKDMAEEVGLGKITQNHIAELAQVSQATVQRVLTGYRHITPEKRRRVEAALAQTGYRLNTAARAIRTGRRGGIGIMAAHGAIYIPGSLLIGIADVLAPEGIHTIYTPAPADKLSEADRLRDLPQRLGIDGILLLHPEGVHGGRKLAELLVGYRIPAIWVNHQQIADCVYFDDEGDARRAVAALLERGHRRLAYVDLYSHPHYSRRDRAQGFRQGVAAAGLPGEVFMREDGSLSAVREELSRALARPDHPTAFVCYSAGDAGVVATLARPYGLIAPRDLTYVAFATNEQYHVQAGVADVGSAAVVMDYRKLGQMAAREMLAKLADPLTLRTPVSVPNGLNFRETEPLEWLYETVRT